MPRISRVFAHEILDSRGIPTLETVMAADSGQTAVASAPAGTSTGKYEAVELRDADPKRFGGQGVLRAVANVNQTLGPAVVGFDPTRQFELDQKLISLDGTANKSKLGANALLCLSIAAAKLAAAAQNIPTYQWIFALARELGAVDRNPPTRIPAPIFNMINGGLHGAGNLDFQEFQIIPASSKPYRAALQSSVEVYHQVEEALVRRGAIHSVGHEGGFAPNLFTNADALEILSEAIEAAGFTLGQDFFLGLDLAATVFFKDGRYSIRDKSEPLSTASLINFLETLNAKFHLTVLEDPLGEDDWDGWQEITRRLGAKLLLVGDDLLVTNPTRLARAAGLGAANAILVKPNQIGTVWETLDVIKQARVANWKIITSHRSGETNDWFIADFAVGVKSDFVKFGAPARGERVAKYNRLLAVETELEIKRRQKT